LSLFGPIDYAKLASSLEDPSVPEASLFGLVDYAKLVAALRNSKLPLGEASYIVFRDGDAFKAKSGQTGAIDYSGGDAATVIQEALNAAGLAGGGLVHVKAGEYPLSKAVSVPDKVTLEGEGSGTVLKAKAGINAVEIARGFGFVAVRRLVVEGEPGSYEGIRIFTEQSISDIIVEQCIIRNMGSDAIAIWGSGASGSIYDVWILNNDIYSCGGRGVLVGNGAIRVAIIGNNVKTVEHNGIDLDNAVHDSIIANNRIRDPLYDCILVSRSDHCLIMGNWCYGSRTVHGIDLDRVTNCIIAGNLCAYNYESGIFMWANYESGKGQFNSIVGNVCRENGYNGIELKEGCRYNTVIGNACKGNGTANKGTGHGILLNDVEYNSVVGNACCENQMAGIYLYMAEGNIVKGNQCIDNSRLAANAHDGIILTDDGATGSLRNILIGNRCSGNRYGVREESLGDYNLILGNILVGNATGSLSTVGANTVTTDNIV